MGGIAAVPLALAPAAVAHGIHAPSLPPDTSLWEFARLGTAHMLGGYDHLLFRSASACSSAGSGIS